MKALLEYYNEAMEQAKADTSRDAPPHEQFPGPTFWVALQVAMIAAMRQVAEDTASEIAKTGAAVERSAMKPVRYAKRKETDAGDAA